MGAALSAGEAPVRERVPLAGYTTLRLGGPAARLVTAGSDDELLAAVRTADQGGEPLLVLGGGSNLVVADAGFPGTVVRVATRGVRVDPAGTRRTAGPPAPGDVTVTVAAGEQWDDVVARCVEEGLAGVECLSGIPGLAGATPIQNVGAYGQDIAEVVTGVRVFDRVRGEIVDLPTDACAFGYRTSVFKRSAAGAATGRFVVLAVTLTLSRDRFSRPIRYPELAAALDVPVGGRAPLVDVRRAVLAVRRRKGMVLDPADPDTRSVGSFFTNPLLTEQRFAAVEDAARSRHGPRVRVPCFPAGDGRVKVPAAWLIEHAGFTKGYREPSNHPGGGVRISTKHTLALVTVGDATTADLLALARRIRDVVHATFGVTLVPEPVLVGVTL